MLNLKNRFLLQTTIPAVSLLGVFVLCFAIQSVSYGQAVRNTKFDQYDKFRQLEEILPTPTEVRLASGAPGPKYWQQRADYVIHVELDDEKQMLYGTETITYHNDSPHDLKYLWVQLDGNLYRPDSDGNMIETAPPSMSSMSSSQLERLLHELEFQGGKTIKKVVDENNKPLKHTIVKTMMRIDLPKPLKMGESMVFTIDWDYVIIDAKKIRTRGGFEFFKDDGNYIYEIAQWFPRMAAYTDVNGWQHKQFLGRGEFTLEFGNYELHITVPDDHVLLATGELQNPEEVLTETQRERLKEAKTADEPMFIVTPEEAKKNEKNKPQGKKTWIFKAENVRDVAFASSRKFIWDAQGHNVNDNEVMCMSLYPNEGEPLWSKYSTHAIMHTLDVYSRYSFDYPYPTAISVNGPVGGMEYPMICFNGPRPEKDGTYSRRTKYGLISVIIHEVGHNYFPMIVNSDERQWTWMDEGLNTFVQCLAEAEWEEEYGRRGTDTRLITRYMTSENQVPIMTNSESILQFGPNGYDKPATALNILRETILGRELFDFAFKEYAQRWMFKRPQPSDLFRTMEDASGVDLDWFWHGWFYTTDHCDLSLESIEKYNVNTKNPYIEKPFAKNQEEEELDWITDIRDKPLSKRVDRFEDLKDFYNKYDPNEITEADRNEYEANSKRVPKDQQKLLDLKDNFYVMKFKNIGGLVMPIILELTFDDDSTQVVRIPAEIWRHNNEEVSKLIVTRKAIKTVVLDPFLETADSDYSNNHYPPKMDESRMNLNGSSPFRGGRRGSSLGNEMRTVQQKERRYGAKKEDESKKEESKEETDTDSSEKEDSEKEAPKKEENKTEKESSDTSNN